MKYPFSHAGTFCLYAHYWKKQNAGQEFRLDRTPLKSYLEHCIRGCEILSTFAGIIHEIFDIGQAAFKSWTLVEKFWAVARDRTRQQRISDLRGAQPGEWDFERIERSFPEFLALDLLDYLTTHGDDRICIVVDTFERLEPDSGRDACERGFQELCARAIAPDKVADELRGVLSGRVGILLFGREQLRWRRYDKPTLRIRGRNTSRRTSLLDSQRWMQELSCIKIIQIFGSNALPRSRHSC